VTLNVATVVYFEELLPKSALCCGARIQLVIRFSQEVAQSTIAGSGFGMDTVLRIRTVVLNSMV